MSFVERTSNEGTSILVEFDTLRKMIHVCRKKKVI